MKEKEQIVGVMKAAEILEISLERIYRILKKKKISPCQTGKYELGIIKKGFVGESGLVEEVYKEIEG